MKAPTKSSGFSQEFSLPRARRIESWAEADSALAELGRLERRQAKLAARRAAAVERVERLAARQQARLRQLAAALEQFCRAQAVEGTARNGARTTLLGPGRRSRRLVFGRVGFHQVHALEVRDPERALAALERNGLGEKFLRVEAQLDRPALRDCLLEARTNGAGGRRRAVERQLARAGVRLETRDTWFYEIHPAAVARWG